MDSESEHSGPPARSYTRSIISRTFTRKATEQNEGTKGPLGLTTIFDPGSDSPATADIVFVHGMNGGSYSTWSKGNQRTHFWPQEWLPSDDAFQDTRIHTFGYPTGLSRESVLNVHDFARSLLAAVKDSPVINQGPKTRIIFVSHSLGGLVVKKAFIIGHQEPEFKHVVDRICSIFFLATPHHGAAIAQALARLIALVPGSRPFVDDLLPQSSMLQSINEDFPKFCGSIQLLSFYETRPMTVGVKKTLIVEKTSAVMNMTNERRTLLDADHRNVAMYSSPNDSAFLAVRNALATVVSAQRTSSHSQKQAVALEDQAAMSRFLGVSDAPEDDIMTLDSIRLPGSCEWLMSNEHYKSWRHALGARFLWLRGRPGAGKTVLAGKVVNDLRDSGADCCFVFCQSGDNTKSTANACLRSLAWQMAMLHSEVSEKLKQVVAENRDGPIDKTDLNPVWRRIFLSGILKVRLKRPQFWVIDAMDECKGSMDMMNFLARVQAQWPVSILVTCRDPVETHLSNANLRLDIRSYTITEEDSNQDISLFLHSNVQHLPCPTSDKWTSPLTMASQIVSNSGGCFLWASLICSELREVTSEREVDTVLDSVPSDMNALYSKILDDMSNARFGRDLAKAFITWTTYAFRPLIALEIQEPIEMDINDKIDDVERAISRCCGNIVYVDSQSRIRLVHSTARDYLTNKDMHSEFAVSKAEGHRRLAMICLQYLIEKDKTASKNRRLGSEPDIRTLRSPSTGSASRKKRLVSEPNILPAPSKHLRGPSFSSASPEPSPFIDYASNYLFQHLHQVHSTDEEVLLMLSQFLSNTCALRWIEYVAGNGELHTIYNAGRTINSLLSRREHHSPPLGLAHGQKKFAMLEKWGDDLIHLVTKFSRSLRLHPNSIHHLIPAFCPPDSAIHQQCANPYRGLQVQGLSARTWDDCLTTITYSKGSAGPNVVAAGPGFFAVGMRSRDGQVIVYDDAIFQEVKNIKHGEPVWRLAFSEQGDMLASGGAKVVRLWSCPQGSEIMNFRISSLCIALSFADEDRTLRVAVKQNQLIEWDIERNDFFQDEPATWTRDLPDTIQSRTPTIAAFGPGMDLMCVIYRGENAILWDHVETVIYDVYEKETGSVSLYGSHKLAEGVTTVGAISFSRGMDGDRLAATYTDGDLIVYDIQSGQPTAVARGANTMKLACANDGRTLAGADSHGNLTLFEIDTLRPLYRIQFDTRLLPRSLVFTSDSHRCVEIRGYQCRVWEPTVLLRPDLRDEENSDTISISSSPLEIDHRTTTSLKILSIVSCRSSSIAYCGLSDGSVHGYDLSGEPESQLLFTQSLDCSIHLLHLDEVSFILASGDISGRVAVRQVMQRTVQRKKVWDVQVPLFDKLVGLLAQILVSGKHSRLLICTDKHVTLWPIGLQREDAWLAQEEVEIVHCPTGNNLWLEHPTNDEQLIRLQNTGSVDIHSWSDLSRLMTVDIRTSQLHNFLPSLHHKQYFATKAPARSGTDSGSSTVIDLWNISSLNGPQVTPSSTFSPFETPLIPGPLPPEVLLNHIVIGSFGTRLILYTPDHWIASCELSAGRVSSTIEDPLIRHFFLPSDWVTSHITHINAAVGNNGEILIARRGELAVIRRGLEVTESGTGFDPRRGSSSVSSMFMAARPRSRGPSPGASASRERRPALVHR